MRPYLAGIVALGVMGLLPAAAMAGHDYSRSRAKVHVSIGISSGVHHIQPSHVHVHPSHARLHVPQHHVQLRHRQVIVHSPVVIVQPCPPPVAVYRAPVYHSAPITSYYRPPTYYHRR